MTDEADSRRQMPATSMSRAAMDTNEPRNENKMSPLTEAAIKKGIAEATNKETAEEMMPAVQQLQNSMKRPQDWALKDATQYTWGISRAVKIRCEANRFVLSAQAGLRAERSIPIADSVSSAADQLVQAIWEFQESWGSAGENVHWKPRLQVQVSSNGGQRLQELKFYLKNSGLVIVE